MHSTRRALIAGHICLDIIPELIEAVTLVPGSLLPVGRALTSTGGAVCNTGLALHRLGIPVRLGGKIGDDLFGREIRRLVEAELGAGETGLRYAADCNTSYTIVLNPPRCDRSFLHCAGANDLYGPEDLSKEDLMETDLLHFGYPPLMRRMYSGSGQELMQLLAKAKTAGAGVSLDMARTSHESEAGQADWPEILRQALPQVDFFTPSIDELLFMLDATRFPAFEAAVACGEPVGGLDVPYLRRMSQHLLEMGAAATLIKLGAAGLYLRVTSDRERLKRTGRVWFSGLSDWAGYEMYLPCYRVRYAGATGAGDCTIAGFLAALLRGSSPEEAMDCALGTGACNVEAPDALSGVPCWSRLQERLHSGWLRHPPALPGFGACGTRKDALYHD